MSLVYADIISVWGIREPFSALSHALGGLLALWATVALVRHARSNGRSGRAAAVYGTTVVLTLAASALFHYVNVPPSRIQLYGRIDHVTILLHVAGTATAIYSSFEARWADRALLAVWGLALAAIAVKLTVSLSGWETALMYLGLGWAGSAGLFAIVQSGPWHRLGSFLAGAVAFSVGAVVYATEWPVVWPGVIAGHEVFHVLVLAGEAFHFHFVYRYCTCPAAFCRTGPEAVPDTASSRLSLPT